MKNVVRFILLPLLVGLAFGVASAQNTTTTGTVTDSDSIAWANGTITFSVVGTSGTLYCAGTPMTAAQSIVRANLDGSGAFSQSLCSNTSITPVNSQWSVVVCSATTAPCQNLGNTTISGGSQSLTSFITASIKALRIPIAFGTRAYADVEILNPPLGGSYFNLTSGFSRFWNGTVWANSGAPTVPQQNFVFEGDSLTSGLHSSTGAATYGSTVTGYAAKTTGSNSFTNVQNFTVVSNTGIQNGQALTQQGGALTTGPAANTAVTGVSGTTISINQNWLNVFSNLPVQFNNTDPVSVAMTLPNFLGKGTAYNFGFQGFTCSLTAQAYFSAIHPTSPIVTGIPGHLFTLCGINDITTNISAATIEAQLLFIYQSARNDGFDVIAATILPAPMTSPQAVIWQQVNNWIRAQSASWNKLVDLASMFPNNYDANLFFTDNEHLTNGGYALMASAYNEALGTQAGVVASPQTQPLPFNLGNTFTASGCSNSTLLGGATAGSYHSGTSGTCTVIITPGSTAPNGWFCEANDLTTPADLQKQTVSTTTTATISGTTVTADVVNFSCVPY